MTLERTILLERDDQTYPLLVTYHVEEPDLSVGDVWSAYYIDDVFTYDADGNVSTFTPTDKELQWLNDQVEWT